MIFIAVIYVVLAIIAMKLDVNFINENTIKLDIILAIVFIILLSLSKKKFKDNGKKIKKFLSKYYLKIIAIIIFLISTANLVYNAINSMDIIRAEASTLNQNVYATLTNIYDRTINNLKNYDQSVYRIENKSKVTENDALVSGYNGISYSGSTYSKTLHSFLEKLGITKYHVKVESGAENTKAVDMLLGVKYFIVPPGKEFYKNYNVEYEDKYIETNTTIYKNPYSLSLGYAINNKTFETNMENNNTFELQNEMLKNMTGINENVYEKHNGEIKKEIKGLEEYNDLEKFSEELEEYGTIYTKIENEGKIIYEFNIENENSLYLYIDASSDSSVELNITGQDYVRNLSFNSNTMINIGNRKVGESIKVEIIPERRYIN